MKLYAYCLAEGLDQLGSISGISSAPVRLLQVADLSVLVSDYDGETIPVTREHALSHAAVVQSVLDQTTPLPCRFGTLVSEQHLRNFLTTNKPAIATKLAHVRGCVEMNVKVIYPVPDLENVTDEQAQVGPGTAFLEEKRRALGGDERFADQRADLSNLLSKHLSSLTRDEQISVRASDTGVLMAAAHLVESPQIQRYREKMATARDTRPELRFLISGPWPPYSFANIELEFKSQFGVS
jgi:Gas vesicle synthesis protein GvpL/GvpF